MKEIKGLILRILIQNGFSGIIPIKDRVYQIRVAENVIVICWVTLSMFSFRNLLEALIWILGTSFCLIVEQIVDLFFLSIKYYQKGGKGSFRADAVYSQSIQRSVYERVNFIFITLIIAQLFILPIGAGSENTGLGVATILSVLILISIENYFARTKKSTNSFRLWIVSLSLELQRGWRQMVSIINQGIRLAISGAFLGVLFGSISQDFWLLIGQISWINLAIVLGLLILFTIIPSASYIDYSIEYEINNLNLTENPFSPEKLYHAIIHFTPFNEVRRLPRKDFEEYEKLYFWKLQKPIYKSALSNLSAELKVRAKWQFWISLVGLVPITLVLIVSIIIALFPLNILADWSKNPIPYDLPSLAAAFLGTSNSQVVINLWDDPILKFSTLLTVLVLTYFANSYTQDSSRVFRNLHVNKPLLEDLITILCGHHILKEGEYQIVDGFYTPVGQPKRSYMFPAPVILIPNNLEKTQVEKLVDTIQEYYNFEGKLICAVFVTAESFLMSPTAIEIQLAEAGDTLQINIKEQSQCWVWLNKGDNKTGLYQFDDFEIAREWAEKNTLGGNII